MILLYLIPYILLFLLGIIIDQKRSTRAYWFFIFVLFVFSGLRYDVGYDYHSYREHIDREDVYSFEPINAWIVSICKALDFKQLFFIIHSFITLFTIGFSLKKISIRSTFSLLLFMGFPLFFLNSMSVVRFWTALSLVFLGSIYLFDGARVKYLLLIFVALGFHTSAVFGLLFILMKYINIPYRLNWIMIALSYFISFISKNLLGGMEYGSSVYLNLFLRYVNAEEMASGFSIIPYIFLSLDVLFLCYYKRLLRVFNNASVFINIYNVGCCIMLVMAFNTTLSMRLSRYFIIYLLVLIPYVVIKSGNKSLLGKRAIWTLLAFLFYIYQLCIFNESLMKYEFLPYNLCINAF